MALPRKGAGSIATADSRFESTVGLQDGWITGSPRLELTVRSPKSKAQGWQSTNCGYPLDGRSSNEQGSQGRAVVAAC